MWAEGERVRHLEQEKDEKEKEEEETHLLSHQTQPKV